MPESLRPNTRGSRRTGPGSGMTPTSGPGVVSQAQGRQSSGAQPSSQQRRDAMFQPLVRQARPARTTKLSTLLNNAPLFDVLFISQIINSAAIFMYYHDTYQSTKLEADHGQAGIYKSEVVRARDKLVALGKHPSIDASSGWNWQYGFANHHQSLLEGD